ncbi:hypothetical protein B7494_g4008 [Chlorociboria aeruginascens]|nr:hypothetical protein B7494_g4008 [Chlorociboria aeruginascens]
MRPDSGNQLDKMSTETTPLAIVTTSANALIHTPSGYHEESKPSQRKNYVPVRLHSTDTSISENDVSGIDSGYASVAVSQTGTPESSQERFADGIAISGNRISLVWPKVTKLREFDQPIPQLIRNRFDDLTELFSRPLYQHLSKARLSQRALSIRLKILGESEETAKPWIVVLCEKVAAKKVRQFFNQRTVRSEYQPEDTDLSLPSFGIFVCERPPRPIAATCLSYIYGKTTLSTASPKTSCGTIIKVADVVISYGTFGGLIKVSTSNTDFKLYGMTAGHIASRHLSNLEIEGEIQDDDEDEDEDEGEDDRSEYMLDDSEGLQLDLDSFDENWDESTTNFPKTDTQFSQDIGQPEDFWSRVGHLCVTAENDARRQNLDWALIEIDDPTIYRPNLFGLDNPSSISHTGIRVRQRDDQQTFKNHTVTVGLSSGVSGFKKGVLSSAYSYLMLAPSNNLVKTYSLKLSENSQLQPGDCGSWVVDAHTHNVYGHVVATDAFGEAYVIPFDATLEDVSLRLGAESVSLPMDEDINRIRELSEVKRNNHEFEGTPAPLDCISNTSGEVAARAVLEEPPSIQLIPQNVIQDRLNANDEFLERRRISRAAFEVELRNSRQRNARQSQKANEPLSRGSTSSRTTDRSFIDEGYSEPYVSRLPSTTTSATYKLNYDSSYHDSLFDDSRTRKSASTSSFGSWLSRSPPPSYFYPNISINSSINRSSMSLQLDSGNSTTRNTLYSSSLFSSDEIFGDPLETLGGYKCSPQSISHFLQTRLTQNSFVLPHLSMSEVLEWKRNRKEKKSRSRFPHPDVLNRVEQRDHVFLLDDSASMRPHWLEVSKVFEALCCTLKSITPDEIGLFFTNSKENGREKATAKLLIKVRSQNPAGITSSLARLENIITDCTVRQSILRQVKSKNSIRPVSVYILTDGNWDLFKRKNSSSLADFWHSDLDVNIQLITFGSQCTDPEILEHLGIEPDSELPSNINITPSTESIWKMILLMPNMF